MGEGEPFDALELSGKDRKSFFNTVFKLAGTVSKGAPPPWNGVLSLTFKAAGTAYDKLDNPSDHGQFVNEPEGEMRSTLRYFKDHLGWDTVTRLDAIACLEATLKANGLD